MERNVICQFESLGETWANLVDLTVSTGSSLAEEGLELRNIVVSFPAHVAADSIIDQFGDPEMIRQMRSVFFQESANKLGHSYAKVMRGPAGRNDLADVIDLLRTERWSKRATVTFSVVGDGKVPCINVVQFLIRNNKVDASYFARGQDAYKKFYADGICLASMVETVSNGLNIPAGTITGFLASSHVYHVDMPAIERFLGTVREMAEPRPIAGG